MEYFSVVSLLTLFSLANGAEYMDLGSQQWLLVAQQRGDRFENVTLPGGAFSDLFDQGYIGDVLYGQNDTELHWVGLIDYVYIRKITVDEDFFNHDVILWVVEGIDTFTSLNVNNIEFANTISMFARYSYNVKGFLHLGENEVSVIFIPSERIATALAQTPTNAFIVPPECPNPATNGLCFANRIRKMQCSFYSEFGPAAASMGVWKETYLLAYNTAIIDYVMAVPTKDEDTDNWILIVWVYLNEIEMENDGVVELDLNTENGIRHITNLEKNTTTKTTTWSTEIILTPNEVRTWWPNGYGSQPLYNLTATFSSGTESFTKTVRVGFRIAELVQEKLETGLSFYFRINDIPIFAKGANKVPFNILPEKTLDRPTIQRFLQTVKDCHMNMIRVWGGGMYESDYFYDLADEYGIMIWQDFMFASSMYREEVYYPSGEILHQPRRLTSHPSLVLWAGNSENELDLRMNTFNTSSNFELYKNNYIILYIDTIKTRLFNNVPNGIVNFITSTPTNGLLSDAQGYVAENPNDELYGDVHFYDYVSDGWNVETYPIPRFASEYGYQSYPVFESWLTATDDLENLNISSDFMEYRQHHADGNSQNLALIEQQLQLPDPSSSNYFGAIIYLSQIFQAQAIKMQTEHYRSYKGRLEENGKGLTMGALYWQLNDVWVAPTWSGIDFTGRWKMLQYFTKNFFYPLIITGRLTTSENLEIFAILDALEVPSANLKVLVRIFSWNNLSPLVSVEFPLTLDTSKAVLVTTLNAPQALNIAGCGTLYETAKSKCFFYLQLINEDNEDVAPRNYVFPEKLKNSQLSNATVQIASVTAMNDDNTEFEIVVSTNSVALFVWLDSHDVRGLFSENGFLQVENTKTVKFNSEDAIDVDDLIRVVTVTHLRDPLYH